MVTKKKGAPGKTKRKTSTKAKRVKRAKALRAPKKAETRKNETSIPLQPLARLEPPAQKHVTITIENIRGETVIGDLLVAFPRTREVLVRNGMRLEAEDAGDIYMTLDAFSALNGLKAESLVQDLIGVANELPPQQPVPQLAAPVA